VVIAGSGEQAKKLKAAAVRPFSFNKSVLHLPQGEIVPQMLPPAFAETIPNIPGVKEGKGVAVLCSNFSCKPPISDPKELETVLEDSLRAGVNV
jgi:uncharacterized protein YyaL (SSP411 family)